MSYVDPSAAGTPAPGAQVKSAWGVDVQSDVELFSTIVVQNLVYGGAGGANNTAALTAALARSDVVMVPAGPASGNGIIGLSAPLTLSVQGQALIGMGGFASYGASNHANGITFAPATDTWTPGIGGLNGVIILSGGHNTLRGINVACVSTLGHAAYGVVGNSTASEVTDVDIEGGTQAFTMGFTNGSATVTYSGAIASDQGKTINVTTGLGSYTISSVAPGTGYTLSSTFTGATGSYNTVLVGATYSWFDNANSTSARWTRVHFNNPGSGAFYHNDTDAVMTACTKFGTGMFDTGAGNFDVVGGHFTSSSVTGPNMQINCNGGGTGVLFDSTYQQASGGASSLIASAGANANSCIKLIGCWYYNNSGGQTMDMLSNTGSTPFQVVGGSAHGSSTNNFAAVLNTSLLIDRVWNLDVNGGSFATNTIAAYFPGSVPSAYSLDVRGAGTAFNGTHTAISDNATVTNLASDTACAATSTTVVLTSPSLPVGTYTLDAHIGLTATAATNAVVFINTGTATATGRESTEASVGTTGPTSVHFTSQIVVTAAGTVTLSVYPAAAVTAKATFVTAGVPAGASGKPTSLQIQRIA